MKNNNTIGFLMRLGLFLGLYALIFKFHPDLTMYLYGYKQSFHQPFFIFHIYPIMAIFTIFKWKEIKEMPKYENDLFQTLLFSLAAIVVFMTSVKSGYVYFEDIIPAHFIYYYPLFIGFMFLFLAIFNLNFVKKFKSEMLLIVYIVTLYTASEVLIESTWYYFSSFILSALGFVLPFFSELVTIDPSQLMVRMEEFEVIVGATCSGIYSMMTFSFLFFTTLVMLKKKVNKSKTALALTGGLAALFILNITRIAIIISIGAFYSPELAIELFHEYLSAVFLIGLFVGYLYYVFPRIILPQANAGSV